MATFFVYDIKWDMEVDGEVVVDLDLPTYAVVWLPGYEACSVPEDDVEAVLDKLSSDFGYCILDYGFMMTVEAEDQEDTSNHPCRARAQ